jgi:hypothetical protein
MDAITLRLEPETIDTLDEEYEECGFRNCMLYFGHLVRERDAISMKRMQQSTLPDG